MITPKTNADTVSATFGGAFVLAHLPVLAGIRG
jgi:hypothetical protein